ncbi:hypothetical protein pdam_00024039, partial [Pocillopora damicornis]
MDGERLCSCYSFNNKSIGYAWPQANGNCKYHKEHLVEMETEQEWEFIKNAIQNREGSKNGEWFIGLEINITTRNWSWVNGKPLTIDKWEKSNPDPNDFYGLIHEEFPPGFKGSFSTINGYVQRGWICEKESDNCQGVCFLHPVPRSTNPPGTTTVTKIVTTKGKTSTERDIAAVSGSSTTVFIPTTVITDDNSSSDKVMIIAASSAAVFFVVLIILVAFINQHDFQDGFPLITLNDCAQPSFSARNETKNERLQSQPSVQREGVYTALCPQSMMTPEGNGSRTYASLDESTREAKIIEYENLFHGFQRKRFIPREEVRTELSPESIMAPEGEGSRTYTSTWEDSDIDYVNQIPNPEYVNEIPSP